MKTALIIAGVLLMAASGVRAQHAGQPQGGHTPDHMEHSFADVEQYAKAFDDPARDAWQMPDRVIAALGLKAGQSVADIGAGTGYVSEKIAHKIGTNGLVYATDIQQEMLDIVEERALEDGALNVMPVMGRIDHCGLEANSVDLVLFVDAYHEFSHPREMMDSIVTALKPGGRVYLVEYRLEDPTVAIKLRHKMTEQQARLEMEAVGLAFVENIAALPQQHVLVFRRAGK